MKKSRKNDAWVFYALTLFSVYVLVAAIFSGLRIPFSILGEEATKNFNEVAEALAVGYLTGMFVYYLTVIRSSRNERDRRIFEVSDVFNGLYDTVALLETEFGKRIELCDLTDYTLYTKNLHDDFISMLTCNIEKALLYKNILTRDEQNTIYEIRRIYKGIEPYSGFMDETEQKMQWNALKKVCELINESRNSVLLEIQNSKK